MRTMSKKRAADHRIYLKLRKKYLEDHPECERCSYQANEIHHKIGRGKYLNDIKFFMAVCAYCHTWIESHPGDAFKLGYKLDRIGKI